MANFIDDKSLVKQALYNSSHSSIEAPKQIKLTELERDVLENGIANNEYGDDLPDAVWSGSIADFLKITTKAQLSGVISSLVKKGLVSVSQGEGNDDITNITPEGVKLFESEYRDGWHLKREGSEKTPPTLEERLQELLDEKAKTAFTEEYKAKASKEQMRKEALAMLAASYLQWDVEDCLEACGNILEDANLKDEAATVRDLVSKYS